MRPPPNAYVWTISSVDVPADVTCHDRWIKTEALAQDLLPNRGVEGT